MGSMRALGPGLLLLLAAGSPARAQEAAAVDSVAVDSVAVDSVAVLDSLGIEVEEPALEFRTNVPWARIVLGGRQSIAGRSPLRVPGPLIGNFWLEADGPGLELQRGRVRFSLDDIGSRVYSYGNIPFRQSFIRCVIFPGLSQARTRQEVKGIALAGLAAGSVGVAVWAHRDLDSAEDAVQALSDRIEQETDPVALASLTEARYDASAEAEHFRARRDLMVKAAGAVWAVGLIDALLFTPRMRVQDADGESLTLSLRKATLGRAIVRSMVFPGLGQEYNGDRIKGAWFAGGGILAASYLLWRQDELNREEAGLRQAELRLAESPGPDAMLRQEGRLRDTESARDARDLALWIAAGAWGVSLLDTALSFQEPWGEVPVEGGRTGTVGWTVDPLRGALAARVRF